MNIGNKDNGIEDTFENSQNCKTQQFFIWSTMNVVRNI